MSNSLLRFTKSCITQIAKRCTSLEMLRIRIDTGGCNGFSYNYSIDNIITKDDIIIQENLAKIVIDEQSLDFIKGATLDYNNELIKSGFEIKDNPNVDSSCGCKISFSIKGERNSPLNI